MVERVDGDVSGDDLEDDGEVPGDDLDDDD